VNSARASSDEGLVAIGEPLWDDGSVNTTRAELPRGTVTFLFTDIEGSTDLARALGPDYGRVRSEHRRILREAFECHSGHEIDTAGDGFFVAFERAADAVRAAVEAQRTLRDSALAHNVAIRVRMGLHSAEPYLDDVGYTGVGVHRASRICAAGHGGQILLSNATAGIVEDLGVEDVQLRDLGEHRLKDLERPQRLFQLTAHDLPAEFPPLKSLDTDEAGASIATLLVIDIAGWFDLIRKLGDERSAAAARNYHRIVLDVVSAENGRELEVAADNVMAAFRPGPGAIRAAVRIRAALAAERWFPGEDTPAVHMAIHAGRVVDWGARHLGSLGYRVHALCDAATPGQILVSHAAEALLVGDPDVLLRHLGQRKYADLEHPVPVFEVAD
jgi:class 3 adenylate cyclase